MKKMNLFVALIVLFTLAAWSFGRNSAVSIANSNLAIQATEPADAQNLTAHKRKLHKKSRAQQLNEWFSNLSLDEKEILYRLKPELDKQRRIREDQMRRQIMQREIAQLKGTRT